MSVPALFSKLYRCVLLGTANTLFLFVGIAANSLFFWDEEGLIRARAYCSMLWAKTMCRILGIRISLSGESFMQSGFTVCNHISYIDIAVLAGIRPTLFVAKEEMGSWPMFGWLARLAGTIFINRGSAKSAIDAMKDIKKAIDAGVNVIVFPEGTTGDGNGLLQFKNAFFNIPAALGVKVIPVSLAYGTEDNDGGVCPVAWYGDMALLPHLMALLGLGRIDAALSFNRTILEDMTDQGTAYARKRLSWLARVSIGKGLLRMRVREYSLCGDYGSICAGASSAVHVEKLTSMQLLSDLEIKNGQLS
ncbi:MAG: 1-acyl-sn-glycerol-3-phosphate acyltransferase [Nitrospirae bacterium]|nr:MAG: 1-acyl-sn-glycerol-3-phosphate acyltransferase [Nitrospirota bacterium]